ncbi:hypothetical protein [Streptomyces sp. ODS28]|uniref:terpene synthase family protein n=1 Tax=Streptomyces sp. ODS28 TaxID=3136688 RepID=UPI0031EE42D1
MTQTDVRTTLPPAAFWCPIDPAEHPRASDLGDVALKWVGRYGLEDDPDQLRRLEQADFGGLTALTMPEGHYEPLRMMASLHATLFAFDDGVCDEGQVPPGELAAQTSRILRLLESADPPGPEDSVFARALREIRVGLEPYASEDQLRYWVRSMERYLTSLVTEAEQRRAPGLPSLEEYVPMWMGAIGMAPSTALIPITAGYEVSPEDLERPRVRALTEMTWTLVAWDNDLYSRAKEIERAGDTLNLIDVLAHERNCSLEQAQLEAVALRDRVQALFLRLREQTAATAGPQLRAYLDGLAQFVRGHLDWASACARYKAGRREAADGTTEGWWKSAPDDALNEPVPVASIAWWWDQLEPQGA